MDADRTPSLLSTKALLGKNKDLYDSAVQQLLDELGLSLLGASNKSEWHNTTRPEAALAARAASRPGGLTAQVAALETAAS